jgi:hypothetical protein
MPVKLVPSGAVILTSADVPCGTGRFWGMFIVMMPREDSPSRPHARRIFIPRVTLSFANALVLKFRGSAMQLATVNPPPIAGPAPTSITVSAAHVALAIAASFLRIIVLP